MKLRITIQLALIFSLLFFNSCNEEQPVEPDPTPPIETIIADNTAQADSNSFKTGLVSIDSAQIVYSSSNSFTQTLVVGGFIVSDYGEGILRKIETIQTQGGQVVVGTRQARLDEVIIRGRIEFSGPINPEEMILESTSQDDFIIEKTKTDLFVSFPNVTFSGSQNLEINASTKFSNPNLTFILEFDNGVTVFETYLEVTNESSIEVITTSSVNVSGSYMPPWAQFVFPPIPTPILVPVIPKLQFGVGGEIGIEQITTSKLSCVTTTKTGFQLINLLPSPIFELNTDANATSDLDILGGHLKTYLIFPKVGYYVTGLLGPFFSQQVYGRVDVEEDDVGTYTKFSWGLFGEGGVEFDLLGYLQAGVKFELYDTDWEIWKNYINTNGWSEQNSGTNESLRSISAVDENIVWISGKNGTILKTLNGGSNWQNISNRSVTGTLFNIFGWSDQLALASNGPSVFRTSDGGSSWQEVLSNRFFINFIWMVNESNGYCFGDPIEGFWDLLETTDGGLTWESLSTLQAEQQEFGIPNAAVVLGDDLYFGTWNWKIYHSSDRGNNWEMLATPNQFSTPIHFKNNMVGLEGDDQLAKTTNGGISWTIIDHFTLGRISGIANKDNEWWYSELSLVKYSNDDGDNFIEQFNAGSENLIEHLKQARNYSSNFTMWAVTRPGRIFKYVHE